MGASASERVGVSLSVGERLSGSTAHTQYGSNFTQELGQKLVDFVARDV